MSDSIRESTHQLKTWPQFFDAVNDGRKTFEVRRNDRDFRLGDYLFLQRWEPDRSEYTLDGSGHPATIVVKVVYLLAGPQFGIQDGFVVMGVHRV